MVVRSAPRVGRYVFCNFPFDATYEPLYLALIAALVGTGQVPSTVLEIPAGTDRLSRILDLLTNCRYSLHDLSRVQLSRNTFRVPRFNMAFELGLAVATAKHIRTTHQFRLLEARAYRLQHSLSDLNGYDPYIHNGTPSGMYEAICDVFSEARPFPVEDVIKFRRVYQRLSAFRRQRFRNGNLYTAYRFAQIVVAAREYVRIETRTTNET
jgi:hypothetical protein